ncbi:hypothetical protein GALMADRAFT_458417 [Galerina marginata CBS 339.88]|uniref:F-box domain-containing protein n=1 Tax=Galerina marginata (strain CBS 339.88) TaxID=685588 RepID=A0A067SYT0_GALM3|nr:hypothetical protein GALMADRAFT_458417 [Galerina marginata CBS 339.88]
MVHLPPEIWLYIATFVPRNDLRRLLGVNRVFLELELDLRFKRIKFSTAGINSLGLQRLSDSFVARRVHDMTVILYFQEPQSKGHSQVFKNMYRQINHPMQGALNLFRKDKSHDFGRSDNVGFTYAMNSLTELGPKLVSLQALTVRCTWNLVPQLSYKQMRPFLPSFSTTVGVNLRQLTLEGNLDEFRALLEIQPGFNSLDDLCLVFKESTHSIEPDAIQNTLIEVVAPFINHLSRHLQNLSLKSYLSALDLSDFFLKLKTLPVLGRLDLREAFIKPSRYPHSLIKLFGDHSHTLQHLRLPLIPFKVHLEPDIQEPLSEWLLECVANEGSFTHLRSLDIYPTKAQKSLDVLLAYIRRTSSHLTELFVRNRFFGAIEAPIVVRALFHCNDLMDLSLCILQLDLTLLEQLSEDLRGLHRLHVTIKEPFGTLFLPLKGRFAHWNLKDIWIMHRDEKVDDKTMLAVARSIPSLERLFGKRIVG